MNKLKLDFRIFDIDPDKVTKSVGIIPSKKYIAGTPLKPNLKVLNKFNIWVLDSNIKSNILEEHTQSLESIVMPKIELFKEVCSNYNSEFSCALYLDSNSEESIPSINFTPNFNKMVSLLNSSIDIDIYIE